MKDEPRIDTLDVGTLGEWLDGDAPLAELFKKLPFLKSESEARSFLDGVREGRDDVANDRTHSTDEVFAELRRLREQRRAAA